MDLRGFDEGDDGGRVAKVEKRLAKRVDKEFEEFLSTQEVEVMHALRKDSKRLRHLLELTERGEAPPLLGRLRSIQDDLGAIRDHDLVIDYLRSRVRLTSTRSLIREEIAKRHARLEDFRHEEQGPGAPDTRLGVGVLSDQVAETRLSLRRPSRSSMSPMSRACQAVAALLLATALAVAPFAGSAFAQANVGCASCVILGHLPPSRNWRITRSCRSPFQTPSPSPLWGSSSR